MLLSAQCIKPRPLSRAEALQPHSSRNRVTRPHATEEVQSAVSTETSTSISRPTLDDVRRLSHGQASSSKRGWGSRQVCHRVNEEERKAFDIAMTKGFLTLKGSGYRKERKGSPLANIFRQYCDARGMACINILLGTGTGMYAGDLLLIDLSPTRQWMVPYDSKLRDSNENEKVAPRSVCLRHNVSDEVHALIQESCKTNGWAMVDSCEHERTKKNNNATPNITLLSAKETSVLVPWTVLLPPQVAMLNEDTKDHDEEYSLMEHYCTAPIWQIPPQAIAFQCSDRSMVKHLAKDIASRMTTEASV